MLFGDGSAAAMAAAEAAKAAVRSVDNFDWTFIALLALVVNGVYLTQIQRKNWNGIAAALALYGVHWLYEIANAVICHFSGYALWHVSPESTTFILLVGVSWELSLMFSTAGFMSGLLPQDKDKKILGMNNRIYVRAVFHDSKVHHIFDGGSALAFNAVCVKVHNNNVVFGKGVVRHAGRGEINIAGFRIANADVAPGSNGETGMEHSFSCFDKKCFIVHLKFLQQ